MLLKETQIDDYRRVAATSYDYRWDCLKIDEIAYDYKREG